MDIVNISTIGFSSNLRYLFCLPGGHGNIFLSLRDVFLVSTNSRCFAITNDYFISSFSVPPGKHFACLQSSCISKGILFDPLIELLVAVFLIVALLFCLFSKLRPSDFYKVQEKNTRDEMSVLDLPRPFNKRPKVIEVVKKDGSFLIKKAEKFNTSLDNLRRLSRHPLIDTVNLY